MSEPIHIGKIASGPHAGKSFGLPLELVTQSIAILAKRGVGKSYTAAVVVEELLEAGQVPVIIDPTGAHWGIKSSADGRSSGYPVVDFCGEHADLPLEENAGETIARAIVEQRFPAIIDLSLLRKGAVRRFITPFLETLYRLNRLPLMLVVDEADDICPQRPFGDEAQMVGAMEDVVKRGRKKGLGCTLITQRPADLAKQVLTQCEVLVAMRLVHPLDIKAVMEWVNVHADVARAKLMVESLPGLPTGTAWFWSPGFGDIFEQVKIRVRRTFDSGATPKPGEKAIVPKELAQVDLAKLGNEITASLLRAKENDPAELKREIARLKADAAKKPAILVPAQSDKPETQHLKATVKQYAAALRSAMKIIAKINATNFSGLTMTPEEIQGALNAAVLQIGKQAEGKLSATLKQVDRILAEAKALQAQVEKLMAGDLEVSVAVTHNTPFTVRQAPQHRPAAPRASGSSNGTVLPKGELATLTALAQNGPLQREQLSVFTGYKRSSRDAYLFRLRDRGFVEDNGSQIAATDAGIQALGNFTPLPLGDELREHWLRELPEGERACLTTLIAAYPNAVTREAIDETTGYKRSSRDAYLHRLKAKNLVVIQNGGVAASPHLFT